MTLGGGIKMRRERYDLGWGASKMRRERYDLGWGHQDEKGEV